MGNNLIIIAIIACLVLLYFWNRNKCSDNNKEGFQANKNITNNNANASNNTNNAHTNNSNASNKVNMQNKQNIQNQQNVARYYEGGSENPMSAYKGQNSGRDGVFGHYATYGDPELTNNMNEQGIEENDGVVYEFDNRDNYSTPVETTSHYSDTDDFPVVAVDFPERETKFLNRKFKTRDQAIPSQYKRIDFTYGKRGGNEREALDFIDESNDLLQPGVGDNDQYKGTDETDGLYARFRPDTKHKDKYKTSEIFNSKQYLPSEKYVNQQWFQVLPEAISVKNRHLINVSHPIGINTIGTSLRNASWDLRGTPQGPKFVVSPWLQSTIEPDTNLKSLC